MGSVVVGRGNGGVVVTGIMRMDEGMAVGEVAVDASMVPAGEDTAVLAALEVWLHAAPS